VYVERTQEATLLIEGEVGTNDQNGGKEHMMLQTRINWIHQCVMGSSLGATRLKNLGLHKERKMPKLSKKGISEKRTLPTQKDPYVG